MVVKIGQATKDAMKLISAERCEKCKVRPKHQNKKWCKYCIGIYYTKKKMTFEKTDRCSIVLAEPLYANASLNDLEPKLRNKLLGRKPDQDLYLFGLPGRGKTHIMAALIRHYTGEGYVCMRICFDEFCCQIRSTMSPASKITEWDMTKPLKEVDMLFIDDLAIKSQETDFAYLTLFLILNKRQERLLPTFISCNKDLERLRQSFDERIISRLSRALIIELKGEDKRKLAEKEQPDGK